MCTCYSYNMYMKKYKINEARKNFSLIINDANRNEEVSLITKRDKPVAYVISSVTAKKYLPEKITKEKTPDKSSYADVLIEFEKMNKKHFSDKKKVNISNNIDQVLYDKK